MTLLESARVVGPPTNEQFEDQRPYDGRPLNADISDAWAPRNDNSSAQKSQITPEMAFLPFTRFALENKTDFNSRQILGLSNSWGYTRHDSVLNPGYGRCHASSTSMSCESGIAQYKGSNSDVPNLYANQDMVNGAPLTKQYFAPNNDVPSVSPEPFRYLNQQQAQMGDDSALLKQVNYVPGQKDVTSFGVSNDATAIDERFEKGLDKPVTWESNSLSAFVKSIENDKPMVVVFGDDSSPLFTKQMQELRQDKDNLMSKLSDRAIFVIGKPRDDEYAHRMAAHLKLTDYPTVSVIAPRTDQLTETYRMEGYFNVSDIFADLNKALPAAKQKLNTSQPISA